MTIALGGPADFVRSFWLFNRARDKSSILECCSDDVVLALFIPQEVLPFGGETIGKSAASDRIQTVFDQFYTLQYEGTVTAASDDMVRGQVLYTFKHKATQEIIEGVMRQVIHINRGLIVRLEEFHDVERIRAFMRLVSHVAQS